MACLFAIFAGAFPRIADIFIWIARPGLVSAAFKGSWIWPVLGIIFLPFTTLMYIILFPMTGGDWIWIVLAVLLDLSHWAHTVYNNRAALPGQTAKA
jgi:hypothetical protein